MAAPTGNLLVNAFGPSDGLPHVNGQTYARDGSIVWSRKSVYPGITDPQGNSYFRTADAEHLTVESLDASGQVRWTITASGVGDVSGAGGPTVLGANGSVYVAGTNRFNNLSTVVGFDTTTGAPTFRKTFGWALHMFAYADGLAVVSHPGRVDYVAYDSIPQGSYRRTRGLFAARPTEGMARYTWPMTAKITLAPLARVA